LSSTSHGIPPETMVEVFGAAQLLCEISISSAAYAIDISYQKWNYNSTIICYECFILLNKPNLCMSCRTNAWRSAGMPQTKVKR
ncbi:MAG TPA: hypothetical protein DFK19_04235, partial [Ochrobactrum sp.]|nr:hypothetical protein [Ochrobactrum sp.]